MTPTSMQSTLVCVLSQHPDKVGALARLAALRDLLLFYAYTMRLHQNADTGMKEVFESVIQTQQATMTSLEQSGVRVEFNTPTVAPPDAPHSIVARISRHEVFLEEMRAIKRAIDDGQFGAFGRNATDRLIRAVGSLAASHPGLPSPNGGWVPAPEEIGAHPSQCKTLLMASVDVDGSGNKQDVMLQVTAGHAAQSAQTE